MKYYLSIVLGLACAVLIVFLIVMKRGDDAQHDNDTGVAGDLSNRLDTAQAKIASGNETILALSNRLDESQSVSFTLSNRLAEVESTNALNVEQITNLNGQVADLDSKNQALGHRAANLTNQIAELTRQIASIQANLARTNEDLVQVYKDYRLLENRLRQDVAEREVVERRFNNVLELQAQLRKLKANPAGSISSEQIYRGLEVDVHSNGTFRVLSRDGF
jgi:chromosome segregation ATPase